MSPMTPPEPPPRRVWAAAGLFALARLTLHLCLRSALGSYTYLASSTEVHRMHLAALWAAHPCVMPGGAVFWLPLPVWLTGGLLRLGVDLLAAPFWLNTAASAVAAAGVYLWTLELAGEAAALGAGLLYLFCACSLVLGIGATADPLLHAGLVWGLFFWTRCERTSRPRWAWACAACFAAAAACRYEAWVVLGAVCLAALLGRRRAAFLPLAAACAVPAAWCAYNAWAYGSPLAFARLTFAAEIRDVSRPAAQLALDYFGSLLRTVPLWLLGLTVAAAARRPGLGRSYWLAYGAMVAFFVGLQPLGQFDIDWHAWTIFLLGLPAAAAVAADWAGRRPSPKRAAAGAALLALALGQQGLKLSGILAAFERFRRPEAAAYLRVRELRRLDVVAPEQSVLVELPARRRVPGAVFELWGVEDSMKAFYDRRLDIGWNGRLQTEGNPSLLGVPPKRLAALLRARRVGAVVGGEHASTLAALGWRERGEKGGVPVWLPPFERSAESLAAVDGKR